MSTKPTVTFGQVIELGEHSAVLGDIKGHPRLGAEPRVRTSRILHVDRDGDEVVRIETQNTIYVREAA